MSINNNYFVKKESCFTFWDLCLYCVCVRSKRNSDLWCLISQNSINCFFLLYISSRLMKKINILKVDTFVKFFLYNDQLTFFTMHYLKRQQANLQRFIFLCQFFLAHSVSFSLRNMTRIKFRKKFKVTMNNMFTSFLK